MIRCGLVWGDIFWGDGGCSVGGVATEVFGCWWHVGKCYAWQGCGWFLLVVVLQLFFADLLLFFSGKIIFLR